MFEAPGALDPERARVPGRLGENAGSQPTRCWSMEMVSSIAPGLIRMPPASGIPNRGRARSTTPAGNASAVTLPPSGVRIKAIDAG
jgi:hypothetical protein